MIWANRVRLGLGAWVDALGAIRDSKKVRLLVALPFVFYGLLLILALMGLLSWLQPFLISYFGEGWIVGVGSYLVVFLAWALLVLPLYFVANLVLAPIHSLTAEDILRVRGVSLDSPANWQEWVKVFFRSSSVGLLKVLLVLILSVPLFLGGLIPGLGIIFLFASMILVSWDCTDYSLDVLNYGLRQRVFYIKRNIWEYVGFSLVFWGASFIPFAIIVLLPLGVVAGANMVATIEIRNSVERGS